jgi:hypothetical protein
MLSSVDNEFSRSFSWALTEGGRQVSDPPHSGLPGKKDIYKIITPRIKIIFKTILE